MAASLVPRPQDFAAVNRFQITWSVASRSSRIRHRKQLIEKAWEKAVQGTSKQLFR